MQWINKFWYAPSARWYGLPLIPLSSGYRGVVALRRQLLQRHEQIRFPVPVIVVGNITVGGTGKTPLVAWLARYLQDQGYSPGIVSRGYAGQAKCWPQTVYQDSAAAVVGDEALMLRQQTGCPVVVAPRRNDAVRQLLQEFTCDVVISDDGLQHYALHRDIEIVVIDGERRFGNQCCLPRGPLREPLDRLQGVDFMVCNGAAQAGEFAMQLHLQPLKTVMWPQQTIDTSTLTGKRIFAVAGIGHPQRFFRSLQQRGFIIHPRTFRDHHFFVAQDFAFLQPEDRVIMTEKDAVKCHAFADERFYYAPVIAQLPETFAQALLTKLNSVL